MKKKMRSTNLDACEVAIEVNLTSALLQAEILSEKSGKEFTFPISRMQFEETVVDWALPFQWGSSSK